MQSEDGDAAEHERRRNGAELSDVEKEFLDFLADLALSRLLARPPANDTEEP